ncbi:TetR/AcrR family transcriptional regulator [Williamsia sp. CHRR-6]|uniref:TetR/AcrR family transcriptional regulator n=1 Tax=Williamsia sp. CHRR-6 TaxID=2835871 RepID=UPI001BD97505|nr:TetR/AcrR family transcriptional regulator [Williamsia sp. CHRR-6]MBT0566896.1 TetR/AcrR family transcriptional regulator [Williamsia sp. CHRR-6]
MADEGELGTRDRILVAAATMVTENPSARLSVRAVAARAGVSTGSLRHFFPTQQLLMDEVAARITGLVVTEDVIDDTTIPARERLTMCARSVLAATGTGDSARHTWRTAFESYIDSEPNIEATQAFLAFNRAGTRRIERWLAVLDREGALPPGNNSERAAYLGAVLDGLSIARALPNDAARIRSEDQILDYAISLLFVGPTIQQQLPDAASLP